MSSNSRFRMMLWTVALAGMVALVLLVGISMREGSSGADVEEEADRLRTEYAARDALQVEKLTETARQVKTDLTPVLEEMSSYLPPDGEPPEQPASSEEISAWKRVLRDAAAEFGDPPSGETNTNIARSSLVVAVDTLQSSVATYEASVDLPAEYRDSLLKQASSQRDLAVRSWSIGATQLDAVNVETGNGHQHVYLPAGGVGGALTADPAPEGSAAHEEQGE